MEEIIDRSRCVVVVPVYKKLEDYDENERQAFTQIFRTFVARDIVLVCPHSLSEYYKDFNRYCLDSKYFTYSGYNELCKSEFFYRMFLDKGYWYMCLVQLDVWVFQDNLEYFLNQFDERGYDYIGAPWLGVHFCPDGVVGNGGFCIRRLSKFAEICSRGVGPGNEDTAILLNPKSNLRIAPEVLALEFSWEEKPYFVYKLMKGKLPMGTHAYASSPDRIGFWKHFIPNVKEIKCKAGEIDIYSNPKHTVGENDS